MLSIQETVLRYEDEDHGDVVDRVRGVLVLEVVVHRRALERVVEPCDVCRVEYNRHRKRNLLDTGYNQPGGSNLKKPDPPRVADRKKSPKPTEI